MGRIIFPKANFGPKFVLTIDCTTTEKAKNIHFTTLLNKSLINHLPRNILCKCLLMIQNPLHLLPSNLILLGLLEFELKVLRLIAL